MQKVQTIQTLGAIMHLKEARRDVLISELEEIEASIEILHDSMREVELADERIVTAPQQGTIQRQLLSFLFHLLDCEGPMHRRDLLTRARQGGIHVGGKDPINQMSSYMSKDDRFVADGQGTWSLSDKGESLVRQ